MDLSTNSTSRVPVSIKTLYSIRNSNLLVEPPVVQVPGAGAYHGGWTSIVGQQTVVRNETAIAWKNWRCETGETFRKSIQTLPPDLTHRLIVG